MTAFLSLRSRIFLTSAALAVLSIAVAIYVVNVRVTRETERELQRQLLSTGALVNQLRTTQTQTFTVMARLVADLPKLKAAVETNDPPTVQDIAAGYQGQLRSSLLLVTNASGRRLAVVGTPGLVPPDDVSANGAARAALDGRDSIWLIRQPGGLLQVVTVPIALGLSQPQILGTLSMGFRFDDALAEQLKTTTGSDIAFGISRDIVASTLSKDDVDALGPLFAADGISHVTLGTQEFVALRLPLSPGSSGAAADARVLVLRSRTEQLRFLQAIHTGLAATAVIAVALAVALSFAVARTITRPLAAITDVMREVARTGDLTRKIELRPRSRWDDEDAQLMAATFNTLTDSIARFQRDMAQKERLSALGRLSTVIAHEIRNPLMIIKASLHGLTRADVTSEAVREAVTDINEEVVRLNRVVNDVLDFARPLTFDLVPVDLNALCRAAAAASAAAGVAVPVHLDLDPAVGPIRTDGERLRLAIVNMLVNAQHAIAAREADAAGNGAHPRPVAVVVDATGPDAPFITLRTRASDRCTTVIIADRGVGIEPADLARVFDPFFTTKRGGTGVGLAIAKNIIEGLGGAIVIDSAPGRGTEIRISLPVEGQAGPVTIR